MSFSSSSLFAFIVLSILINLPDLVTATPRNFQPVWRFAKSHSNSSVDLFIEKRQVTLITTCGFADGDPGQPRTANPGFDCRVDTKNGIWGFCPTTVISASDCGLAGSCVDSHGCSKGCGLVGQVGITTFVCTASGGDFCSTAILTAGRDQTYSYIACANAAATQHLVAQALITTSSSAASTTTSSKSSSTTSSSSSTSSSSLSSSVTSTSSTSTSSQTSPSSTTSILPSATDAAPSSIASQNTSSPNLGTIIGGSIGGAVIGCCTILAILYFVRRYRKRQFKTMTESRELKVQTSNLDHYDMKVEEAPIYRYNAGFGPAELGTRHSPVELES